MELKSTPLREPRVRIVLQALKLGYNWKSMHEPLLEVEQILILHDSCIFSYLGKYMDLDSDKIHSIEFRLIHNLVSHYGVETFSSEICKPNKIFDQLAHFTLVLTGTTNV